MIKAIKIIGFIGCLCASINLLADSQQASMIQFVDRAKLHAEDVGKYQALKDFSNPNSPFHHKGLHIFAYDFKGKVIAHGAKPKLVGKHLIELEDATGTEVVKVLIDKVKQGDSFMHYQWKHPRNQTILPRLVYVTQVDDTYWIGSGMYIDKPHSE